MTWQKLSDATKPIANRLYPQIFTVALEGELATAIKTEAARTGTTSEAVITEAVRAYVGAT
jgi:hypothetical protein